MKYSESPTCWTGKKPYLTWNKAESDLKKFKRRRAGATRRAGRSLEIYQCSECRAFNIGNSKSGLSGSEVDRRLIDIEATRKRQEAKARRRLGKEYEAHNNKLRALLFG